MRLSLPSVSTLVEIRRGQDGEVPASLISAAYRASRTQPVMLVLAAVSPAEVDDLLDSVVGRYGHTHRGLVYASLDDEIAVLRTAAQAQRVFAASDGFRQKLSHQGISFEDVSFAEPVFQREASDAA